MKKIILLVLTVSFLFHTSLLAEDFNYNRQENTVDIIEYDEPDEETKKMLDNVYKVRKEYVKEAINFILSKWEKPELGRLTENFEVNISCKIVVDNSGYISSYEVSNANAAVDANEEWEQSVKNTIENNRYLPALPKEFQNEPATIDLNFAYSVSVKKNEIKDSTEDVDNFKNRSNRTDSHKEVDNFKSRTSRSDNIKNRTSRSDNIKKTDNFKNKNKRN